MTGDGLARRWSPGTGWETGIEDDGRGGSRAGQLAGRQTSGRGDWYGMPKSYTVMVVRVTGAASARNELGLGLIGTAKALENDRGARSREEMNRESKKCELLGSEFSGVE